MRSTHALMSRGNSGLSKLCSFQHQVHCGRSPNAGIDSKYTRLSSLYLVSQIAILAPAFSVDSERLYKQGRGASLTEYSPFLPAEPRLLLDRDFSLHAECEVRSAVEGVLAGFDITE
jgi:hypothetical protein